MPIHLLGRAQTGVQEIITHKEWLVTNGIGGYASGTVASLLTRRYHGLLMAALHPPLGRTLLVAKIDETVSYDAYTYPLFANRWRGNYIDPKGFYNLERFALEGTTPLWTYALGDALLEKRVWMEQGANTTYIQYTPIRATQPLHLQAKILVNYRDYHSMTHTHDWQMQIDRVANGVQVVAYDGATPFYLLGNTISWTPNAPESDTWEQERDWYQNFELSIEQYRGAEGLEDHLCIGSVSMTLAPGESVTLVATTEENANLDGHAAYARRQKHEAHLLEQAHDLLNHDHNKKESLFQRSIRQLTLAADQFIVQRPTPNEPEGKSIIAGYHWFGDWGRDTMIALPGLSLATGRPQIARSLLRTFAHFIDQGMIPNRFPDQDEKPEYNTVDATLWFVEAVRAYHATTHDLSLVRDLFPALQEIVHWHRQGTRYNIHLDPKDGLLYAGEAGVQLTWMDAKVGDWVVTPRIGKPVEINALWYNALCILADFARLLEQPNDEFENLALQAHTGFERFWSDDLGYCDDVLDGPGGNESHLRPNQLFAVSLYHSPLNPDRQKAVVDICARHLLTSHGLRSLAANDQYNDNQYIGHYGGDQSTRDAAYHQGTVWAWLIGPFISAYLRVYRDPAMAQTFLLPLLQHLDDHGLGSISEIFDGDPPFMPRGAIAQAWSVAEVLRVWQEIQDAQANLVETLGIPQR